MKNAYRVRTSRSEFDAGSRKREILFRQCVTRNNDLQPSPRVLLASTSMGVTCDSSESDAKKDTHHNHGKGVSFTRKHQQCGVSSVSGEQGHINVGIGA